MEDIQELQCQFCGDNCGEAVCYGCRDTFDMFGIDAEDYGVL